MTEYCHACGNDVESAHDAHWSCPGCESPLVIYCKNCDPSPPRCPRCGKDLEYHRESTTRKAFHNPATRRLLGF